MTQLKLRQACVYDGDDHGKDDDDDYDADDGINRDVESNSGVVTDVERKEHCPTFTSNVQGLLRTKMEGGKCVCVGVWVCVGVGVCVCVCVCVHVCVCVCVLRWLATSVHIFKKDMRCV